MADGELLWCRNCTEWRDTGIWQGNCDKHHTKRDRWTEEADANHCPDYKDKRKENVLCKQQ